MNPTPRQVREAFTGVWSYSQAQLIVRNLRDEMKSAWEWVTPRVREALVAERCFGVCRQRALGEVRVRDMDHLLAAMRFAAGLVEWDEVKDWATYAAERCARSE